MHQQVISSTQGYDYVHVILIVNPCNDLLSHEQANHLKKYYAA